MSEQVLTIVGAGPGLGAAIARRFGGQGYRVGLIARDPAVVSACADELNGEGIETGAAVADVSDAAALRGALDGVAAELGQPDVVLSNTSMMVEGLPTQIPVPVFEQVWRVACLSTLITLQHVAPAMLARGSGTFLVPGTALALRPWANGVALGAAKSAARNLVISAADELAPSNVHAAMITIDGMIAADGPFSPTAIAEVFWSIAQQPADQWQPEVVYSG